MKHVTTYIKVDMYRHFEETAVSIMSVDKFSEVRLRSFVILRSVEWQFLTDVSEQPIGPIFKGQAVQENETNILSRKVGNKLPFYDV
jgi:hypothetical protein